MKKREAVPWAWIKIEPTHLSDQQHHRDTEIQRERETNPSLREEKRGNGDQKEADSAREQIHGVREGEDLIVVPGV